MIHYEPDVQGVAASTPLSDYLTAVSANIYPVQIDQELLKRPLPLETR